MKNDPVLLNPTWLEPRADIDAASLWRRRRKGFYSSRFGIHFREGDLDSEVGRGSERGLVPVWALSDPTSFPTESAP